MWEEIKAGIGGPGSEGNFKGKNVLANSDSTIFPDTAAPIILAQVQRTNSSYAKAPFSLLLSLGLKQAFSFKRRKHYFNLLNTFLSFRKHQFRHACSSATNKTLSTSPCTAVKQQVTKTFLSYQSLVSVDYARGSPLQKNVPPTIVLLCLPQPCPWWHPLACALDHMLSVAITAPHMSPFLTGAFIICIRRCVKR